ncbi:prolyl 4-hydroxylase subunit alpha-1-like [Eriocheir sinensis]|uniref:prolyl 4-hydroxylase subunit alpha-1-like n=1 Tax=Eriocheir sinensis TaxID=95602 RepID=UPI0021C6058B|nr:prolyl 4-hydroxylase subunit alpha-1-like [Eriocheir sinensis]XP_050713989.1 prolyl 4-hydroxylase subunit alpha-1-like [Eriocheir sinensis]
MKTCRWNIMVEAVMMVVVTGGGGGGGWRGCLAMAGVEELARLHTLDGVITGLLKAHLHLHLPDPHLHPTPPSLSAHLERAKRYIEEHSDLNPLKYNTKTRSQEEVKQEEQEEEKDTWERSWEEGGIAGDPLRSLVLARRLAKDWPRLKDAAPPSLKDWPDIVAAVEGVEVALRVEAGKEGYLEVLEESLAYLQHLYRLDALHLAKGSVTTHHHHHHQQQQQQQQQHRYEYMDSTPLRVEDVVGVGVAALELGLYGVAVEWLVAAKQMSEDSDDTTLSEDTSSALWRQNQHLSLLLQVATDTHDDKLAMEGYTGQKGMYPHPLSKVPLTDQKAAEESKKLPATPRRPPLGVTTTPADMRALAHLCRGRSLRSAKVESRLRCRASSRGSAWLTLMPVWEEEVSLDPLILIFHRLLSDDHLTTLKHLGAPLLLRATVQGAEGTKATRYRASHTAWLGRGTHPLVESVNKITAAVTGLEVEEGAAEAEMLQVNQYGAGGHYIPHMDFMALYRNVWAAGHGSNHSLLREFPQGDRIATLMFYMNDVAEGGQTVFPRVGVGVAPEKGSAIFWWNLLTTGMGDDRTLHAACPVLRGTKWVSNKWIKYYPQLYRRPCPAHSAKMH